MSIGSGRHRTPSFTMATHLGAKSDMERDSGFSDASSEYLSAVELTDTEESGRHGQTVLNQDPAAQQVALMGSSYAGVSPMIIMNNFLLKQPSNIATSEKQWGISSPMEVMPQSQVVLLQPMLSNGSNSTPKAGCENGRQSRSYTPFKSYPRIAPHPGEHLYKRAGSSRLRGSSENDGRQRRHHHSHRMYSAASTQATLQTSVKQNNTTVNNQAPVTEPQGCDKAPTPLTGFSSVSSYTQEFQAALSDISVSTDKDPSANDCNKLKRFSNTYNILSKSGLLGITMRTKQLIKENRHTQSQLQQLQEQTSLLLEALSSGDAQLWTKLQLSLQDTEKELSPAKSPVLLL
ncbi:CLOCK-interacting pacemaker a [Boleophthalmus pectinirostris]|uniref:CLOCK-interacting pacemaker a n=1 Tax=Boleophthalmus pectinirostris TaxID=150288 RepID=UPI000A1C6D59|nr:CLOCK-interacting pacemaker a [Boleophthalmus pectinirostris]